MGIEPAQQTSEVFEPADAWQPPSNVRWRIVGLLLAYSFMTWFNRVSMAVAYDEQIKTELAISKEDIGAVYSAFLIAYMIFMTPGSWFTDRVGSALALAIMGIGSGLLGALTGLPAFLACSAAQTLGMLLVIRTVMGVVTAPVYPASARMTAHWLPFSQRALVNGLITAAALLGIAFCYPAFGVLQDHVHWSKAFLITGSITLALGLFWTWYARDLPRHHRGVNQAEQDWIQGTIADLRLQIADLNEGPPSSNLQSAISNPQSPLAFHPSPLTPSEGSWLNLLRCRSLVFLTLSYAAIGYFEYLFYFWVHDYFQDVLGLPKERSRLYAMITYLAMAGGMALGGWLADRLGASLGQRRGRALVAVGGMLTGALLVFAGLYAEQPEWIVVWIALAMAAVGAAEGPCWATAIDLGGRHKATAAGIFNTGGNAGGAVAPWLTPVVSKHWGPAWSIGLGSVVCLIGVCFWLWIDPGERRQP